MSCQNGVCVHLLKYSTANGVGSSGDHFETGRFGHSVFSSVGLKVSNHDVFSLARDLLCIFKHPIGLSHSRRIAKVHVQPPAAAAGVLANLGITCGGKR